MSHTSSPELTPNCTKGRKNELHTVDWDEFKYRQLDRPPIVEVCTIAVPLNAPHHNVNNWDYSLKMTYRSMITASTDIDRFISQLSTLMAAEKSWETNSRTRRVTGNDETYHDYRPRLFDPANERNRIRSREIEHHSYKSIERDHQSENLQSMARSYPWIGDIKNRRRSWKTIASQHSATTSLQIEQVHRLQ